MNSVGNHFIANFSSFDIEELIQNTQLPLKENINYLGNGVNMRHMTEKAQEHFELLEKRHQISGVDEELKVSTYTPHKLV